MSNGIFVAVPERVWTIFVGGIQYGRFSTLFFMWKLLKKVLSTGTVTEPINLKELPRDREIEEAGKKIRQAIQTLYGGRSLRIRHVDAGSTNGEENELTALGNAYYDLERFGIGFVASPRHADILTVSGPVTRNMEHALRTAYEMTPEPRFVIAVGDGACTGGIWKGSYAIAGAVEDVIPVQMKIAGDPPSPLQFMRGLLAAIEIANR